MAVTLVGLGEYAAMTGMAKATISDARNAGKIKNGWDVDLQKFKYEIAEEEWGIPYRKQMEAKGKVFTPKGGIQPRPAAAPAPPPVAIPAEDDTPNGDPGYVTPFIPRVNNVFADQMDLFTDLNDFTPGVKVDLIEAVRVKEYNEARYKKMRADELAGLLIRKSDVEKQLQVAGMELRKEIERLPNKCIDDVRGAKDRNEAIIVMEDIISDMLERMGDIIETALKNQQMSERG
jgi:hypothetical protein